MIKLRKNITFIKPSYIHKRSSLWHSPRQSRILNSRLCQWILDSNLKWDSGFLKLYSGFQSPGFQIPQAKSPESRFPFMGRTMGVSKLFRCRKTSNFRSSVRFNQNKKKSLGFLVDCNFCHFNASIIFIAI